MCQRGIKPRILRDGWKWLSKHLAAVSVRFVVDKSVSFRSELQSNVSDIIRAIGLNCMHTASLIVALASDLAAYAEEGVPLAPTIFICNSVDDMIRMLGPGEHVELSPEAVNTDLAAAKVLKAGAYLCSGVWNIYVERSIDGRTCKFGIFCGSTDPASAGPDEILVEGGDGEFPIVRVKQTAKNKVQIKTSVGDSVEFRFNDDENAMSVGADADLNSLVHHATQGITQDKQMAYSFLRRTLATAIDMSHGTLIAIISSEKAMPADLCDGIQLNPPIDLMDRFKAHFDDGKTSDTVSRLQAAANLLTGLVGSDGITVLDDCGRIRAYRTFVKSGSAENASEGGARTRAFKALSVLDGVKGAYFRSQDGRILFHANGKTDVE